MVPVSEPGIVTPRAWVVEFRGHAHVIFPNKVGFVIGLFHNGSYPSHIRRNPLIATNGIFGVSKFRRSVLHVDVNWISTALNAASTWATNFVHIEPIQLNPRFDQRIQVWRLKVQRITRFRPMISYICPTIVIRQNMNYIWQ